MKIIKNCKICNKEFEPIRNNQKNCSELCGREAKRRISRKNYQENKTQKKIYYANNKEKISKRMRDYYGNHKEQRLESMKDYQLKNKLKISKQRKEYYQKNKKKLILYRKNYYLKNKNKIIKKIVEYRIRKINTHVEFKLLCYLRTRIYSILKGINKSKSTMKLVGCSIEQLKQHLQKQFTKGMSWSNYGKWHIDHIKPCASFDLTKPKEQKKCFHYTNLQPLWAVDNLSKGVK